RDGVRSVAADDAGGGRLAAEHLLRLGHTEVLHVTGDLQSQAMSDRADAFPAAYAKDGVARPQLVVCDELSALGAYRAMARHLGGRQRESQHLPRDRAGLPGAHTRPLLGHTAVFAATDEMATGVIAAHDDAGSRVPADVSVVG